MNPVICIAGPTASGKSAWALSVAKKYKGEIINADAMQVYSDLQIISARPTIADMEDVPHHLFGHIDGSERYSVGKWLEEAVPIILDVLARGKLPILTGGTGLYFKALTEGLASVPKISTEKAAIFLDVNGIKALRVKAEALDPVAASRVLGNDPQRLIRIVSVAEETGQPLSVWQQNTKAVVPKSYWLGAVLTPDRAALYERINARFDIMMANGGIDEVKRLMQRGLAADLPVMRAIGVSQFVNSEDSIQKAIEYCKRDTRRFAKRQYTWFRGQAKQWCFTENFSAKQRFEEKITKFMD